MAKQLPGCCFFFLNVWSNTFYHPFYLKIYQLAALAEQPPAVDCDLPHLRRHTRWVEARKILSASEGECCDSHPALVSLGDTTWGRHARWCVSGRHTQHGIVKVIKDAQLGDILRELTSRLP